MTPGQTNHLLGYPSDARLLILNADDFGMSNATNEAIFRVLQAGVVRSTTLMVPCFWARHAMRFLANHPEIPFGVHLTAISDHIDFRWGPLTSRDKVPTLVNPDGKFYVFDEMPAYLAQADLGQMEMEFRAQIEAVLAAGLKPSHLDWHALRLGGRPDIVKMMVRLARQYGLAFRVYGQPLAESLQGQGLPTNDYDFLDSSSLDPATKPARYAQLLHELPAGLSEWAVHPGLDSAELLAMEPTGKHFRQTDFEFWTSQAAQDLVKAEGIILLDYRALQAVWSRF